uniref:Uncharacterized protein n=1 Tax=viral metagenome TaxID=1070528 RepID=A0A6C0AQZ7_9ZZZZ
MNSLTINDYKNILQYYSKPIPKSKRILQMEAEKIMSDKLCRCIKKVEPQNEAKSIGICTKTIFNNKGYTRGKFKCKGKSTVTFKRSNKKVTRRQKK